MTVGTVGTVKTIGALSFCVESSATRLKTRKNFLLLSTVESFKQISKTPAKLSWIDNIYQILPLDW